MITYKEVFEKYRQKPGRIKEIYSINFFPYLIETWLPVIKGQYNYSYTIKAGNLIKGEYVCEAITPLSNHEWDICITVEWVQHHRSVNPHNVHDPLGVHSTSNRRENIYLYLIK